MRVISAGALGAVAGCVLVWLLATFHHWDVLPEDLQAAFSGLIGGALSFLGGYVEHLRAARNAARDRDGLWSATGRSPGGDYLWAAL
jgi:H+/Cl- antiporter ClcA